MEILRELGKCRMCDSPAVVRVDLSDGCICYPDDRVQDLCYHHYRKATPLGSMDLIASLPAIDAE